VEVQNRTTAALKQATNQFRNKISFSMKVVLFAKEIMNSRLPDLFNSFPFFSHIAQKDLSNHTKWGSPI
jgi:hypothetical protein